MMPTNMLACFDLLNGVAWMFYKHGDLSLLPKAEKRKFFKG
jgi:hypothetical protein